MQPLKDDFRSVQINMKHVSYFKVLFFIKQKSPDILSSCYLVGNPNRKKMHIFGFVGIFEYIC